MLVKFVVARGHGRGKGGNLRFCSSYLFSFSFQTSQYLADPLSHHYTSDWTNKLFICPYDIKYGGPTIITKNKTFTKTFSIVYKGELTIRKTYKITYLTVHYYKYKKKYFAYSLSYNKPYIFSLSAYTNQIYKCLSLFEHSNNMLIFLQKAKYG